MKSKKNIVFLGMMGSGKTSIGLIVSKKLPVAPVKNKIIVVSKTNPKIIKITVLQTSSNNILYMKINKKRII